MIIALSCTKNWYYYLMVNIYSLLRTNNNVKKIYLLLETDKVNNIKYLKDIKEKFDVEFILINVKKYLEKLINPESPNANCVFTYMSFSRLILSSIIEEDKVLYIDTDAIVIKDISYVWNLDISDYYVIGVKDQGVLDYKDNIGIPGMYINSGFVVFNLDNMRKDNIMDKCIDLINCQKLLCPDQDALNMFCTDKEKYIPSIYNCSIYTKEVKDISLIKVMHYAGVKDYWVADSSFAEIWYNEEEKFINDIIKSE